MCCFYRLRYFREQNPLLITAIIYVGLWGFSTKVWQSAESRRMMIHVLSSSFSSLLTKSVFQNAPYCYDDISFWVSLLIILFIQKQKLIALCYKTKKWRISKQKAASFVIYSIIYYRYILYVKINKRSSKYLPFFCYMVLMCQYKYFQLKKANALTFHV